MENSNRQVKEAFEKLLELRQDICNVIDILYGKYDVLVSIYRDLVTTHRNSDFVFGLDSFFFQNKLIKDDCDHLSLVLRAIDNRIYCEYLTVYKMMKKFVIEEVNDIRIISHAAFNHSFKPYKHLDEKQVHDIRAIKEIYQAIISCNIELETLLANRESDLKNDKQQSDMGINIDNLIYMESFRNEMLGSRIKMFYKYLCALNNHHTNYYTRLLLKAKLHMGIVEEDVLLKQFNQSGITNIDKLPLNQKPVSSSPVAMKETETHQIKSYVGYDTLPITKQSVLDGICIAGGSDNGSGKNSHADGSDNGSGKNSDISGSDNGSDINSHISGSDNESGKNSDIGTESHDNASSVNDDSSTIPEESEIASHAPKSCQFDQKHIGERVVVQGYNSIGVLRFVGKHVTSNDFRCGVEFDDAIGRNNGTVKGHKYFECQELHGVLVAPYKVSLVKELSLSSSSDTEEN
jgi:hypothetical protein